MISRTKVNKRMRKKTNSELARAIFLAKKSNPELASLLSLPARRQVTLNLEDIGRQTKERETIIIPGKVLSNGSVGKKIKIIALNFSKSAKEKLKRAKCEAKSLLEELEKNKKIDGRILKK